MPINMENTVYFSEKQKFKNPLIWIPLIIVNCLMIYLVLKGIANAAGSAEGIIIPAIVIGVVLLSTFLLYSISLDTQIRKDGVYFRFYPLQQKYQCIPRERISQIYVRQYKPLREYGGWGYRVSITGNGKALNISGNQGIQIIYDENKKLLLGTQKPAEADMILKQWYADLLPKG